MHANDTLVLNENIHGLKQKVVSTYEFFNGIDQDVNVGKSKFMHLDSRQYGLGIESMVINGHIIKYTMKEKYLGHYITDDNSLLTSITSDLEERASNVIVKFRNFVNNHKNASIQISMTVFQACFCSTVLSNRDIWGNCLTKKVLTLYNRGLRIALEVRPSTPTSLIFLETRQPSVFSMVRKKQLCFWQNLKKDETGNCKKYSEGVVETLEHFIFDCSAYNEIRWRFDSFPYLLKTFLSGNFVVKY